IDNEVVRLIKGAYDTSKTVLQAHMQTLHALSSLLLEKETVLGKELDELIYKMEPGFVLPKRPEDTEKSESEPAQVAAEKSAGVS
ncbi:MAG: cell division protein FtsH, partial [Desulfatitalea sp.]|nr:cell division protein FtsH [Desulfatitalea sp.]